MRRSSSYSSRRDYVRQPHAAGRLGPTLAPLILALLALALPSPGRAQDDLGDFQHMPRADESGEDRSLVVTRSADGLVVLGWQCTATGMRTLVALGWRWVGNEDDDILVAHRFPADSTNSRTLWRLSQTGTVAWMRIGETAAFTESALEADSVWLNLSDPFDGETREAAFGVRGLDQALSVLGCDPRRPSVPGTASASSGN